MTKPTIRPTNPNFSCGPCSKPPGWSLDKLKGATLGRSHRSSAGRAKLAEVLTLSRKVLGIPADYRIAIVPASDTGAMEMAMWTMLGARSVTVLAWENFSRDWAIDVREQLKLPNATIIEPPYGVLPDLRKIDFSGDVVFPWNGTTSGVTIPNGEWIPHNREGLTICDATSAAFAIDLPWNKLDVVTYSWQKALGGEAQHGTIILSPRAAARLESYTPRWPVPKLFRMAVEGELTESLFKGETINTPSLLCVEDALVSLKWADSLGGAPALQARCTANAVALDQWISTCPWATYLAAEPTTRSRTSVCLKMTDPWFNGLSQSQQATVLQELIALLEREEAAFDIAAYRTAPAGLRVWCGPTVETSDIEALGPWLDWAYAEVKGKQAIAA